MPQDSAYKRHTQAIIDERVAAVNSVSSSETVPSTSG